MDSSRRLPAPNRDELIALGLLDPAEPDAEERQRLLQFLMARGATIDDLERSRDIGALVGASLDQTLRPGPRLTRRELSWRTNLDDDVLVRLRQAMGLPDPGSHVAIYTEADVLAARAFERLALLFGEAVALQLMRVAGAALARVSEAAVSAFMVNVHAPLRATSANEVATGRAFAEVVSSLPDVARLLEVQLRHHVEAAVHQFSLTRSDPKSGAPSEAADLVNLTVGFADVVGSTAWARSITPTDFAAALQHFATLAGDIVAARGGRVVKLIGDEIMFVAADPGVACELGLDIVAACADQDGFPPVRVGAATGSVISRDGDYHGEVVHLASRLVRAADPGAVVVTSACARGAATGGGGLVFRSVGVRGLRGFDEPVEVVTVQRRVHHDAAA